MKPLALIRDRDCERCKLHKAAVDVCVMGSGPVDARVMVVSKMPSGKEYHQGLLKDLAEAGLDGQAMYHAAALKCRNFDQSASNLDVKQCKVYLEQELMVVKPEWILTLGNEALLSVTGRSGIMKHRARVVDLPGGAKAFPTISPSSVARNPGQRHAYMADLHLFAGVMGGRESSVPKPKIFVVDTRAKHDQLVRLLQRTELLSYDVETRGMDEHDPMGCIVSLSGTSVVKRKSSETNRGEADVAAETGQGQTVVWALPLSHPQSVWRRSWQEALRRLADAWATVPKQVAHNGKFDAKWLRAYGVPARVTFDTMLAASLLDENRQKGLKPQAASRLGVAPWAIETKDLWSTPIKDVLRYNALDTWYTYHIYLEIRQELLSSGRLTRLFKDMLMPANEILIQAERRGIWVDEEKRASHEHQTMATIADLDEQLMQWVPDPDTTVNWPTYKNGKKVGVNFNPSIFSRWLLFDHLGLPELDWGKEKPDGSPGDPSMREAVMLELKGTHPIVETLLDRAGKVKTSQFLKAYGDLSDAEGRIHTTFKLSGTVTGRLSSGKEDREKITAAPRGGLRGLNVQQVPRDPFVRGVLGSPPGWVWVEVDFSQIELRLIAFVANEKALKRLYQMGQDVHASTASWVLGVPQSEVTKDQRKKAKAVNFGFMYGMGAAKFVKTAFENYEATFTLEEAQAIRRQYFERFPGIRAWHNQQRRLVHKFGRVISPMGRVRNLPDIRSEDEYVVAEAERQAINSPIQAMASDMNQLGMILTMRAFRQHAIDGHVVGLVHDATLFEIREDYVAKALPTILHCYEGGLMDKLAKDFKVHLDVPIVGDLKVGSRWGGSRELTRAEAMAWNGEGLE